MLFNGAVWFILLSKISTLFIVLSILSGVGFLAALLTRIGIHRERGYEKAFGVSKKISKALLPVFIATMLLAIMVPNTKEMILAASFKAVDTYNETHPDSMVSTNGVVGTADNLVQLLNASMDRLTNILEPKKEDPSTTKK